MTDGEYDAVAYRRGVTAGMEAGSGLLARLFGVRSHGLFDDISASGLSDNLSGLLVGTEFEEALAAAEGAARTITLLGRGDLMERYSRAAEVAGVEVVSGPSDAAAQGQYLIARAAGLIGG